MKKYALITFLAVTMCGCQWIPFLHREESPKIEKNATQTYPMEDQIIIQDHVASK